MEQSTFLSDYMLPIVIALIMFNLGLSLVFGDFKKIIKFPKPLIVGLISQMILLPTIAFTIATIANLPDVIKVGIVIIAACPGGATSNLITYYLKGDVALSISLTSSNSILILFSIPTIIFIAMHTFLDQTQVVELPFLNTLIKTFVMILIPTTMGLLVRRRWPVFAKKTERIMKYITTALLAFVFLITFLNSSGESEKPVQLFISVLPYVLLLNIVGMFAGFYMGRMMHFNKKRLITLSVEVGIQNSALAITIASSPLFLNNPKMAVPALIYGIITFFNAVIFGYIVKKWFKYD